MPNDIGDFNTPWTLITKTGDGEFSQTLNNASFTSDGDTPLKLKIRTNLPSNEMAYVYVTYKMEEVNYAG